MNLKSKLITAAAVITVSTLLANSTFAGNTVPARPGDPNSGQINISGSTLFASFFSAPSATNDWIDVNLDKIWGYDSSDTNTPQQLAPDWSSGNSGLVTDGAYWLVQYRGTSSGNGLKDLLNYFDKAPTQDPWAFTGGATVSGNFSLPAGYSYANRAEFADGTGNVLSPGNTAHAGCYPIDACSIDIAIMDVPTTWFVQQAGTPAVSTAPTTPGYGTMAITAWNNAQSNKIKTLTSTSSTYAKRTFDLNGSDALSLFDTKIAWVPIVFIANPGTGLTNVTQNQLKYLYTTGRMPTGENLVACTRDSGSGTRNGAMNSLGADPSWGRGDNMGAASLTTSTTPGVNMLGATGQPTNLSSTGIMENVVTSRRLGIGYIGFVDAASASLSNYEILNIQKTGYSTFVRPDVDNILHNSDASSGWQFGGNETMVTVGNPNAQSGPTVMRNQAAASYVRNIADSMAAFDANPNDPNYFMPGGFLAQYDFPTASTDAVPNTLNPSTFVTNPSLNSNLQAWVSGNNYTTVGYSGQAGNGVVPTRFGLTAPQTYSDHQTLDYVDVLGGSLVHGQALNSRNKIMGDFNGSGVRDINQIPQMMVAFGNPNNLTNKGVAGNAVCPAIIGDFTGDGNFNAADIRYFADGLALNSGKLDRATGFTMVDQSWNAAALGVAGMNNVSDPNYNVAGNFFKTTLATGRAYAPNSGWSRADIAGNGTPGPGSLISAADGKIDDKDIDYINYVLRGGYKAAALGQTLTPNPAVRSNVWNFADANQAPFMDLSCDMNGDMKIDSTDVDYVVQTVLGTNYGDVNLDGKVDFKDFAILAANYGKGDGSFGKATSVGWAKGDVNGDGFVDMSDVAVMSQNWLSGY